jgi:3-hydroxyacyl-[acyl-carrier-protein] dehydratase
MQLTREEIQQIIPHRPPFLLVDSIIEMEPGKRIVGIKDVRHDEWYLQGHFPGIPIMPGVLIMEALAQTGAVAVLSLPEHAGHLAVLAKMDNVKFRKSVVPGDQIRLQVELIQRRKTSGSGKGEAYVNDQLVAEGVMMFFISPKEMA